MRDKHPASLAKRNADKREALNLRVAGAPYHKIADHLGCSATRAAELVAEALAEARRDSAEAAESLRGLMRLQLDQMTMSLWPKALKGDVAAVDRMLRIQERLAKLEGVDAPVRVDVDYQQERERIMAAAKLIAESHPEAAAALAQAFKDN